MESPREPGPAALIVGALYAEVELLEQACRLLEREAGKVRALLPKVKFDFTDYYRQEMGDHLFRRLLLVERLVPRQQLADWKLKTCALERELRGPDGRRRVNLDAGLLAAENLVLASTKGRDHRVYLGRGIFAEVTLRFSQGRFVPLEWTYPDWRSREMLEALGQARAWLLNELGRRREEIPA